MGLRDLFEPKRAARRRLDDERVREAVEEASQGGSRGVLVISRGDQYEWVGVHHSVPRGEVHIVDMDDE